MASSLSSDLEMAVTAGHLDQVKRLYAAIEPLQKPKMQNQIAQLAAGKGQAAILDWTLSSSSSSLALPTESLNNELYHQACYAQSMPIWTVLINHGLDLNAHHSEYIGDALSLAAYHGNMDIIRFLLEHGQDPNLAWGYNDRAPAVWVLEEKHPLEILNLMLQHGWRQENSAAHIAAAELGNMEALELLVEAGVDLEQVEPWWFNPAVIDGDKWGTALYRAAYAGQAETVKYLLQKGASIHFRDRQARSILWAAKQGGDKTVMCLLQDAGLED